MLVIRDTRESGEMLEAAVAAGIAAAGGDALLGGVLPTPGAPLLIDRYGFDLAAVLSASHNPYQDNGIKFFGGDGYKLSDATEAEHRGAHRRHRRRRSRIGRVRRFHGALEDYLRALHERFAGLDLAGRRILLDCANGATYEAGPEVFRRLGAHVDVIAATPDGRNINAGCGSTHLEPLKSARWSRAVTTRASPSTATATVCWPSTAPATVVDGDELIAMAAKHLGVDGVAVTVMTNYGFHAAMRDAGIEVATTTVGDRYVLAELRERGWRLGGEQSGHIIDMGFVPSGDGIAAALLAMESLEGGELHERHAMEKLPQTLVNVRFEDRDAVASALERLEGEVAREAAALEGRGRVLVRPSGTEPLVRVMVEAPSEQEAEATCSRLVSVVDAAR